MTRTEEQKRLRKQQDFEKNQKYREYYDNNLLSINQCKACGEEKKLEEFVRNISFKNTCKDCHKNKTKKWRNSNIDHYRSYMRGLAVKSYEIVKEHKSKNPCTKCGKKFPICAMDFNHLDRKKKKKNISQMGGSVNEIKKEIEKCELICANCHRNETQQRINEIDVRKNRFKSNSVIDVPITENSRNKWCKKCDNVKDEENFTLLKNGQRHTYCKKCLREVNKKYSINRKPRGAKKYIIEQKDGKACTDCKETFRYWQLDFDHLKNKTKSINNLQNNKMEAIKKEIDKCELVCANCHRIRTAERKAGFPSIRMNEITQFLNDNKINCAQSLNEIITDDVTIVYEGFEYFDRDRTNKNKGKNVISIFEDEWRDKRRGVENLLLNRLVKHGTLSLRPSKCEIRTIPSTEANNFYETYHYIGKCKAKVHYGVFYKDELIGAISFGHPTRQSKHKWELIRMCSSPNQRVHGIWSKLMKHFIKEYEAKSIVSFSDNRLFSGGVYEKIGFVKDGSVPSDYYWIKNKIRYHKSGLRKKDYERDTGITEDKLRRAEGYEKVWDLGKTRWVYKP